MADVTQPWGLVHGRINVAVGDTADAGRAPDRVPVASGVASFTATIDKIITNTPGQEAIDLPQKIDAQINNGALQWNGTDDVPLIASVGKGWQWRVDFSALKYTDPNTGLTKTLTMTGWPVDVKVYDPVFVDPVTGTNTTVTQLTDSAPVLATAPTLLAKGDPGPAPVLATRNKTTTTDPNAAGMTLVPTGVPGSYWVDYVQLVGVGGPGGGGTVSKVAGIAPDGTGNVDVPPSAIGAATAVDLQTAQQTASNALTTANSAQSAANTAQTTAQNAQNGLASKADLSALAPFAPLASPTFTGDPKAPTPATADNDTSIATTAFVRSAITAYAPAAGSSTSPVAELVWDVPTQKWVNGAGTAVTARPTAKLVVLYGTTDANAVKPAWLAIGDVGIWHPDSAYNS